MLTAAACPTCKSALPDPGAFAAWCPSCEWNLNSESGWLEWKETSVDKLINKVRGGQARKQFEALAAREPGGLRGSWTVATVATYVIAALVNFFPLLLLAGGAWVIAANWPAFWAMFWGGMLILGAWVLRPRRDPMPKNIFDRSDIPRLYDFVDRVALANGAPKVHALVLDATFNASFQQVGWGRRTVVTIGLPLWSMLTPQERVALLSHEFAHGLNGDSLAHGFVGQAINTLIGLADLFQPDYSETFAILVSPLLALISGSFRWLAYLMLVLFWQKSQQAEFLADYSASRMSGSEAAISLLQKLPLANYARNVLDPISFSSNWQHHNFFPAFKAFITSLPAIELERTRRLAEREDFASTTTHPPRWARVRFLERHRAEPALVVDSAEMTAIDQELAQFEARFTGSLLAAYYPDH